MRSRAAPRGPDHRDPANPGMNSRPPKPFRRNGHFCPKCAFYHNRMHTFIKSMHSTPTECTFCLLDLSFYHLMYTLAISFQSRSNLAQICSKSRPNFVPISSRIGPGPTGPWARARGAAGHGPLRCPGQWALGQFGTRLERDWDEIWKIFGRDWNEIGTIYHDRS